MLHPETQVYFLGGNSATNPNVQYTSVSLVAMNSSVSVVYPLSVNMVQGRSQFGAAAAPTGDIVVCGGDSGGDCEVVVTCPTGYTGPYCFNTAEATCSFGFYRVNGECAMW